MQHSQLHKVSVHTPSLRGKAEAIQRRASARQYFLKKLDCRVATLLAMTVCAALLTTHDSPLTIHHRL